MRAFKALKKGKGEKMASFVTEPKMIDKPLYTQNGDPIVDENGIPKTRKEQERDANNVPLTLCFTDARIHKTKVSDAIYDALHKTFVDSGYQQSDVFEDPVTGKKYVMKPGNAEQVETTVKKSQFRKGQRIETVEPGLPRLRTDPEHGIFAGPIIEEVTETQAKALSPEKAPVTQEILERMEKMQEEIKALRAGKKEEHGGESPPAKLDMNAFVALHWKAQEKAVRDGKADDLLMAITQSDVTARVKDAAQKRLSETVHLVEA